MRSSVIALVLVCVGVLAACGTAAQPPASGVTGTTTTAAAVPSHAPEVVTGSTGTVSVVVEEPLDRAAGSVRFLRVEDADGKIVLERSYRSAPPSCPKA